MNRGLTADAKGHLLCVLIAALVLGGLLGGSRAVASLPFEPPSVYLMTPQQSQAGNIKDYCWTQTTIIRNCASQEFYVFPKRPLASDTTWILFDRSEPPDSVHVRYWSKVRRYDAGSMWMDEPRGLGRTVRTQMRPTFGDEGISWAADFEIKNPGTVYISVRAVWHEMAGLCSGCRQWAVWTFSMKGGS